MVAMLFLVAVTSFWVFVEYQVTKKNYTNTDNVSKQAKWNNAWLLLITVFCFSSTYNSFFIHWKNENLLYMSVLGSIVAFLGLFIRRIAIVTLGKHFDALVQVKKEQELIQHGLYRNFRHPSYTGTIIAFFGFGIASMSVWNAILFPTLYTVCYIFRIQFEEKVLENGFGNEYTVYKAKTWGLLPWFKKPNPKKEKQTF